MRKQQPTLWRSAVLLSFKWGTMHSFVADVVNNKSQINHKQPSVGEIIEKLVNFSPLCHICAGLSDYVCLSSVCLAGVGSSPTSQWDFWGSTLVTSSYVRLTPDERSKQGSIWNTVVRNECRHSSYLQSDWQVHLRSRPLKQALWFSLILIFSLFLCTAEFCFIFTMLNELW